MPRAGEIVRVFVSSTFSDMREERNALQERVFPRLRELCTQHGARFQAIDLRWGVSEQAGHDQRTMAICLSEVRRCLEMTPCPNFIALLGSRYGWLPLPYEIPADEFDRIKQYASDTEILNEWYRLDENAAPPVCCLQPRTGQFAARDDEGRCTAWEEVEERLHSVLADAVERSGLTPEQRSKYVVSATEHEIEEGIFTEQAMTY